MNVNADQIDALFTEWDTPTSPGCVIAIIRSGETIHQRGYGMANLEYAIPLASDSVFDIGSMSKQFTALSVVLLARQGKLSLDDEIQQYLPEIRQYERPLTIRHLIHHTSGLRDYLPVMRLAGMQWENHYPGEQILNLIARQKQLLFPPGEHFLYSNSGYLLLAQIVQRVSGNSLRAFAEAQLFAPLGMKGTHFHDDFTEIVAKRAVGYAPGKEGGFQLDVSLFDTVGDGLVYTTVEDLCRWDHNYYDNRVGGYGQDLINEITTPARLNSGERLDYAYGLRAGSHRGMTMIHHGGASAGYRSYFLRFPQQRFSVVCLANLGSISPKHLAKQAADLYLWGDLWGDASKPMAKPAQPQPLVESSPQALQEWDGYYLDRQNGVVCEVAAQEDGYLLQAPPLVAFVVRVSAWRYASKGSPFDFEVDVDNLDPDQPTVLYVRADGQRPAVLHKLSPIRYSVSDLCGYTGTYTSEELDTTYDIALEDGQLVLQQAYEPKQHLKPVAQDLFIGGWGSYKFDRNEQSQVTGFKLSAVRASFISFAKCSNSPETST